MPRAPRRAPRGRGLRPWLRSLGIVVPPTSLPVALRVLASKRIFAVEDPPEPRDPPLGLRAAPARGGTGIARAASPGGPDGFLGQQPHGVASGRDPASRSRCPRCSSKSERSLSLRRRSSPASRSRARSAMRISSTNCSRYCSIASSPSCQSAQPGPSLSAPECPGHRTGVLPS
jgi:hypothetical protein